MQERSGQKKKKNPHSLYFPFVGFLKQFVSFGAFVLYNYSVLDAMNNSKLLGFRLIEHLTIGIGGNMT